jgi:dTDP-4-amino-4,6-dideoxygalactose transaminase
VVNAGASAASSGLNRGLKLPCFRGMRVPLVDLNAQYLTVGAAIRQEIDQVLASQRFILGPKVQEFEKAMTEFCGSPHAIGVSSGTDALLAILMAFEIGRGDAVITTPYTFFATAGCVARLGAKPVFVDIDRATYNLSPLALERFLEKKCQRRGDVIVLRDGGETVRAIIPVHLFGLCCDMTSIQCATKNYQLLVIEDAAQAIGAQYPSSSGARMAGTMGHAGFFSFYPSKNLGAAGDAGLILCRESELAKRLFSLRDHGMLPRYHHQFIGGNFRLDEIQAAVLKVKLPHLKSWSRARRAAADFYRESFTRAKLNGPIDRPAEPYREQVREHHVYHQYVIRTPKRDDLRRYLTKHEIGSEIYYPVALHLQECFRYLGYHEGDFPESEEAAQTTLALPMYAEISRDAQQYVVDAIAEFLR